MLFFYVDKVYFKYTLSIYSFVKTITLYFKYAMIYLQVYLNYTYSGFFCQNWTA